MGKKISLDRKAIWVSTAIAALLVIFCVAQYQTMNVLRFKLQLLEANAASLYPYIPKLDRDFEFTIDYYRMKVTGTYKTDYLMLYTGAAEKPELYFLRDFSNALNRDDVVFFDVGANKGFHSLFMSVYVEQVHAFEPYPPVLDSFYRMIADNKITNIKVHPVGLGDAPGSIPFYAPRGGNIFTGSFDPDFTSDNEHYKELPIEVGDDIVAEQGIKKVDILKVDVEGYEKPVLRGLKKTLEQHRPLIIFELLEKSSHKERFVSHSDLVGNFPRDYEFFYFSQYNYYTGAYKLSSYMHGTGQKTEHLSPRISNIVACPAEMLRLLPVESAFRKSGGNTRQTE